MKAFEISLTVYISRGFLRSGVIPVLSKSITAGQLLRRKTKIRVKRRKEEGRMEGRKEGKKEGRKEGKYKILTAPTALPVGHG